MKLPSSSGVTMTTESCSFSSKWTCDAAPALGGASEKRTPPPLAHPKVGRGNTEFKIIVPGGVTLRIPVVKTYEGQKIVRTPQFVTPVYIYVVLPTLITFVLVA